MSPRANKIAHDLLPGGRDVGFADIEVTLARLVRNGRRRRTAARALSRLEELAVAAAAQRQVDVAVAHLANPARAEALAASLRGRLAANLGERDVSVGEVGAVIGAHVGPGMVAVVVAPR